MPELPDVEGFRRRFARHALGRPVRGVEVIDRGLLRNRSAQGLGRALRGREFIEADRHGKWLIGRTGGPLVLPGCETSASLTARAVAPPCAAPSWAGAPPCGVPAVSAPDRPAPGPSLAAACGRAWTGPRRSEEQGDHDHGTPQPESGRPAQRATILPRLPVSGNPGPAQRRPAISASAASGRPRGSAAPCPSSSVPRSRATPPRGAAR